MQRQDPSERPSELDEDLLRRLDALSRPEAERVLERAIRIHDERREREPSIDRTKLYQIAAELGIEPQAVDRALGEEMSTVDRPVETRFFAPRSVSSRVRVTGTAPDVAQRVHRWMTRDEGLRPAARTGDGISWVPDTNWKTTARVAIAGKGTKTLKGLAGVTHRQIELSPDEHVVEIDADTNRVGIVAGSVGGGLLGGAVAGGVAAAFGMAGGNDLLQFLMVAVPGAAVAMGTSVITAKAWTQSIRTGVSLALTNIAHPDVDGPRPGKVRKLVDDISDGLDDWLR